MTTWESRKASSGDSSTSNVTMTSLSDGWCLCAVRLVMSACRTNDFFKPAPAYPQVLIQKSKALKTIDYTNSSSPGSPTYEAEQGERDRVGANSFYSALLKIWQATLSSGFGYQRA